MSSKWKRNIRGFVNILNPSAGTIMKYRTGPNLGTNVSIINDTGTIHPIDDSDFRPQAMKRDSEQKIVPVFLDTTGVKKQ